MSGGTRIFAGLLLVLLLGFGLVMLAFAFGITLEDEDPVVGQVIALITIGGLLAALTMAVVASRSDPAPAAPPQAYQRQANPYPPQYAAPHPAPPPAGGAHDG